MKLKYVIPNMEKTFERLKYAGKGKVEQRRISGRMTTLSRSYNLYSDIQRADDIEVILPVEAGEKHFEPKMVLESGWLVTRQVGHDFLHRTSEIHFA